MRSGTRSYWSLVPNDCKVAINFIGASRVLRSGLISKKQLPKPSNYAQSLY